MAASLVAFVVLFATVYLAATAYLFFRDDLMFASYARQAEMRDAYEDRIAALRSQIDRISSRQLLNEHALEDRLDTLLERQQEIGGRHDLIAKVIEKARAQGLKVATALPRPRPARMTTGGTPADDTADDITGSISAPKTHPGRAALNGDVNRIEHDLTEIEVRQSAALDAIVDSAQQDIDRARRVASRLGVKLKSLGSNPANQGGPYIPLDQGAWFKNRIDRAFMALSRLDKLRTDLAALPLRQPLQGRVEITSKYGPRLDPFLRRPAMHSGIDYRSKYGRPVVATAPGRIIRASRQGGYGRVVIIDHGAGITSRYAHLSRYKVRKGHRVRAGQVIGLVGSSGRSTGPHLHYELRRHKQTVNPMVYLNAGRELKGLY